MTIQSLEFIIGTIVGLAFGYVLSRFWIKQRKLNSAFTTDKNEQHINRKKLPKFPEDQVKRGEVSLDKNLNTEEIKAELQLVLQLLDEYKTNPNTELLEKLEHELEIHDEHNILHEYLEHEQVELEKVAEMVEINHELLTEENGEGDTALHVAEHHGHHEVAEWMVEHAHFGSEHERHHFLAHHNHHGHTALHDAAHLWHYHPPHNNHFFHMVEKHPIGSLMWEDAHGKTVYEHYFEHPDADRHRLLETLEHKGVIHKHDDHYELSEAAEKSVREAHHSKDTKNLEALLVKDYSPLHHKNADVPAAEKKLAVTKEVTQYVHPHNPRPS